MYNLFDLPYKYDALEPYIDTETMHVHHDKHYATYTNRINEVLLSYPDIAQKPIETVLSDLTILPEDIRTSVQNFGGGYYNHTLFFDCLSPVHDQMPGEILRVALEKTFGSFSQFQELFTQKSVGKFGSGWTWLVMDEKGLAVIDTTNQDTPLALGKTPLLCLDLWEHAYYLKYRQARSEYVKQWWHVINWQYVETLYRKK